LRSIEEPWLSARHTPKLGSPLRSEKGVAWITLVLLLDEGKGMISYGCLFGSLLPASAPRDFGSPIALSLSMLTDGRNLESPIR
jgi:hypothetical protein